MRLAMAFLAMCLCAVSVRAQTTVDPKALFEEAQQAQQKGDLAAAAEKYGQLIRVHPEVVAAHANLGVVLADLGRYDEAITQYHFALTEAPGSPPLRLDLALAYYKKGDFTGAAAELASLHNEQPDNVRIATLLANCQLQMGLAGEALAILQPLEKDNADNLDVEWALGMALLTSGKSVEGLKRIQKVAEQRNDPDAYQMAANLYLRLTYFDDARNDAEQVLRLRPNSPNALVVVGMVDDYSGASEKAAEEYQKAIQLDPNNIQALVQLGAVLVRLRRFDEAKEMLNKALALDPTLAGAAYQLGQVEKTQGNLDAALKDFEKAEQDDQNWIVPHVELVALYYRLKRPEDGDREKAIVDRMRDEDEKRRATSQVVSPQLGPEIGEPAPIVSK